MPNYCENNLIIQGDKKQIAKFKKLAKVGYEYKIAEARDEYLQLRNDDNDFAKQWRDSEDDFNEWYNDVYFPSKHQE